MEDVVPMLISLALGTVVGWERQMGRKPAGLRTHVLVCLGSTMFCLLVPHAIASYPDKNFDPTRIVHGVITGIGFLGAGSVIRHDGFVHGLTTAASVWMVAAIGVAVGMHAYPLAVTGTVLALIVLEFYRWVERFMSPSEKDDDL